MGVAIANNSNYFQGTFHTGKIAYNDKVLTTNELQNLGMKDNELLHTQATESYGDIVEHFSKEEMGIIKIRGMMYPYALMYNNRNDEHQLEKVMQEVLRDSQMLKEIYGTDFAEKMQDVNFLKQVQKSVKPYDNILEFAEGMSKKLLGIEQVKKFGEIEIGKSTVNTPTENKDKAKSQLQRDKKQISQQSQKIEDDQLKE